MPLDLHVLGLSLAFILSQDQTLHCKFVFVFSLKLPAKVCILMEEATLKTTTVKSQSTRKIPQKGDPFKITPGFTIYSFNLCFIERVPICSAILQLQNPCILCFVIKRICKSSKDLFFALTFPKRVRFKSGCKDKRCFSTMQIIHRIILMFTKHFIQPIYHDHDFQTSRKIKKTMFFWA